MNRETLKIVEAGGTWLWGGCMCVLCYDMFVGRGWGARFFGFSAIGFAVLASAARAFLKRPNAR